VTRPAQQGHHFLELVHSYISNGAAIHIHRIRRIAAILFLLLLLSQEPDEAVHALQARRGGLLQVFFLPKTSPVVQHLHRHGWEKLKYTKKKIL
jgi:hypothetical protein